MPNFKSDLGQELILSEYLDTLYKAKGIEFFRIIDLEKQHQGIDLIIKSNSMKYFVDEKAQLHYLNEDLPTFTFELSYLKDTTLKEGWLFDQNKLTQYYFLVTGIFLKKDKLTLLKAGDIDKLKITSVNRSKLIDHLISIGLEKGKLLEYGSKLRLSNSFGKNILAELNPKTEGLLYFTEHLNEKPINLQLRLKYLIENKIAKKFHWE